MFQFLSSLFGRKSSSRPSKRKAVFVRSRPTLEMLEQRWMPTLTPHGGPVIANVEVQALFYGSTWSSNPTLSAQATRFDDALSTVAHGPYLRMLSQAGYGVGEGSWTAGKFDSTSLGSSVTDKAIQTAIQTDIKSTNPLAAPDANRLYIVYVPQNVEVFGPMASSKHSGPANSVSDFAGYHGSFPGTDAQGKATTIRYAVISTPGGTVGNAANNGSLSAFDEMTEASTHEMAEAVTNPDGNAWFQNGVGSTPGQEIGDLANGKTVYLYGYAVQQMVDQNDNIISPPVNQVKDAAGNSFDLNPNGTVYEHSRNSNWVYAGAANISRLVNDASGNVFDLSWGGVVYQHATGTSWYYAGASSISNLVSDAAGNVLDLSYGGVVYQHSSGTAWYWAGALNISSLVSDAKGNVFDLAFDGTVYQHASGITWNYAGATSINKMVSDAAGNVFDLSFQGTVYQHTLGTLSSWNAIGSGNNMVSDATGNVFVMNNSLSPNLNGGNVFEHIQSGGWRVIGGGTDMVSDASGNLFVLNATPSDRNVYEHTLGSGASWTAVDGGFNAGSRMVSDASGAVFLLNYSTGTVYQHNLGGTWSWVVVAGNAESIWSDDGNVFMSNRSNGKTYEHVIGGGGQWVG